jgi:hypothetical protein
VALPGPILTGVGELDTRNFSELRQGIVRLVPGPIDENFSSRCTVTRLNPLIHTGATTATKSGRFDPKGGAAGSIVMGLPLRRAVACYVERPKNLSSEAFCE